MPSPGLDRRIRSVKNPACRVPRGRVLLVGGIHGDEYSSVTIVFKWMAILNRYHSGLFHWRISPLMNPDGLLQRRSKRMNANGVDLNRNWPTEDWADTAVHIDLEVNAGSTPLSEPEVGALYRYITALRPTLVISWHGYASIVEGNDLEEAELLAAAYAPAWSSSRARSTT